MNAGKVCPTCDGFGLDEAGGGGLILCMTCDGMGRVYESKLEQLLARAALAGGDA